MAIFGYARVSTDGQNLDMQIDALNTIGCEKIFIDKASGLNRERPGWDEAEATLQSGDTLAVWKLDRLGRSTSWLSMTMDKFKEDNINFKSLNEGIDTSTSMGRLFFGIIASLAQFESELIGERTKEGMKAARKRGKRIGRPLSMTPAGIELAQSLLQQNKSWAMISESVNIPKSTLRRHLGSKKPRKSETKA